MGGMTDFVIANWQQKAGIKPATGERTRLLEALSQAAFKAIKIIELERSGIRDGDGGWHGGDVIAGFTGDLISLSKQLLKNYDAEFRAMLPPQASDDDEMPF